MAAVAGYPNGAIAGGSPAVGNGGLANGSGSFPNGNGSSNGASAAAAAAARKKLTGYVGFANLPNQVHRKSVRKGFSFTAMVVGECFPPKSPSTSAVNQEGLQRLPEMTS